MPRNDLIQVRAGTAANWIIEDPVLADRELGYETDTGKSKIGDGVTAWSALDYTYLGVVLIDVGQTTPPAGTPAGTVIVRKA